MAPSESHSAGSPSPPLGPLRDRSVSTTSDPAAALPFQGGKVDCEAVESKPEQVRTDVAQDLRREWEESPEHPTNWPNSKRWTMALVIALTGFLSTLDSSIFVPALSTLQARYGAGRELATLTISLFVVGLGCGPFVFAPISELYGRQKAYVASMIGFTIMNLGCCFVDSLAGFVILRFLCGFFGSSGPGLGVATISDLFKPHERGRPIAIYGIGPMLGPVIGSMLGNWLVLLSWRWPLRIMTVLIGINTGCVMLCMRETYAPVLERRWLARRTEAAADEVGSEEKPAITAAAATVPKPEIRDLLKRTFSRPPRMLLNPVCALFATYYAWVYGCIYVFIVSTPLLFARHDRPTGLFSYDWPAGTAGLGYVPLGIGFIASATTAALTQDRIYRYLSKRYGNNGVPEYRLVITQIGMIVFPAGLFLYGWTAEAQTHWIGPMIGSCILSYGLMLSFNSCQNFIVDAFSPYSAAAMAAATLLRSVTGAILPIWSPAMYESLGYGLGCTLLACVSLPAIPAPFVLFMLGDRMRDRWKFKE